MLTGAAETASTAFARIKSIDDIETDLQYRNDD
jgi:hypothetical protein